MICDFFHLFEAQSHFTAKYYFEVLAIAGNMFRYLFRCMWMVYLRNDFALHTISLKYKLKPYLV